MLYEMKAVNLNLISSILKVIILLCAAFIFIFFAPQYGHYILLALGVGLFGYGANSLNQYTNQERWVETKAKLKRIEECEEEVAVSEYYNLKYYYPIAEYEYAAKGVNYTGSVVSLDKENIWVPEVNDWGEPTSIDKRWWASLKPGDEMPVYFNPTNESQAVLIKSIGRSRRSHYLALAAGGILLVVIWLFLVITT